MFEFKKDRNLAKHPLYDQQTTKRAFWKLTYKGDIDYVTGLDARGRFIIPRFLAEDNNSWYERKYRTKPRNHAGPIIKKFNDFTFRNKITRTDTNPVIQELYEDADARGCNIDDFMRDVMLTAQIEGISYILPDTTKPKSAETTLTKLQAIYEGERPFLRKIDADDVVNWTEIDGYLVEAVVLFFDSTGKRFARYYNESITFDIQLKEFGKWYRIESVGPEQEHGFAHKIPLVPVKPFDHTSQIAPLAEIQQEITNFLSLLNQEIYAHTFTKTLLTGVEMKDDEGDDGLPKPLVWGSNEIMTCKGKDVQKISMGSDVNQTQMLLTVIGNDEENLYRTAGVSMPQPQKVGQPESGVTLAFKQNDLFVNLKAIADDAEAAERQVLDLIYIGWGLQGEPGEVEYDDNFDEPDLMAELAELQQMKMVGIPNAAYNNKVRSFIAKFFSLTTKEQSAVEAELAAPGKDSLDKDEPAKGPDDRMDGPQQVKQAPDIGYRG